MYMYVWDIQEVFYIPRAKTITHSFKLCTIKLKFAVNLVKSLKNLVTNFKAIDQLQADIHPFKVEILNAGLILFLQI